MKKNDFKIYAALTVAFSSSIAGGFLSGYRYASEHYTASFNKPYSIHFQDVTEEDILKCQADENCMDIMPISTASDVVISRKSSCSPEVLNRGWLACDNPDCCEEMRPALREVLTPEMTERAIEAYQKK